MFVNIGKKIKTLTVVLFIINVTVTFIGGIVLLILINRLFVLLMIFGPLISWIGSFFMYGFGELIENTSKLVKNNQNNDFMPASKEKMEKLQKLERMKNSGIITEEEYQRALSKDETK